MDREAWRRRSMGPQESDTTGRLAHRAGSGTGPAFSQPVLFTSGSCWAWLPLHSHRATGPSSQLQSAPLAAHPSDPPEVALGWAVRACLEEQRLVVASAVTGVSACPTAPGLSLRPEYTCWAVQPRPTLRARLVPSGPEHCPLRAHSPAPCSTYPQPKKTVGWNLEGRQAREAPALRPAPPVDGHIKGLPPSIQDNSAWSSRLLTSHRTGRGSATDAGKHNLPLAGPAACC